VPVFTGPATGFVAGFAAPPATGALAAARIYRTGDGGAHWAAVWTAPPGLVLTFMGATPGPAPLLFAAGTDPARGGAATGPPAPVLVTSGDGGATWTVVVPALPASPTAPGTPAASPLPLAASLWPVLRFSFVSRADGFAWVDAMDEQVTPAGTAPLVLATRDGGRRWSALSLPAGLAGFDGALDFRSPEEGWVGGTTAAGCSRLWRTADGGQRWTSATGCLGFRVRAIDFTDAAHGFAGGGNRFHGNPPFEALLATSDGGATWHTVDAGHGATGRPFVELLFSSAADGLALEGTAPLMLQGGFEPADGTVLRTRDGGRTWTQVAAGAAWLVATGGAVWAADLSGRGLQRSGDGGASWTLQVQPASASVADVQVQPGGPGTAWVRVGPALFARSGAGWTPFPGPPGLYPPAFPWFAAPGIALAPAAGGGLLRTADGGGTWAPVALPAGSVDGVTFASPADGWAALAAGARPDRLLRTRDGGVAWSPAGRLPLALASLSFGPGLWAASGSLPGTGPAVAVSTDAGASWDVVALPGGLSCGPPAVAGPGLWLPCQRFSNTAPGGQTGFLLHWAPGVGWSARATGAFVPVAVSMATARDGDLTAAAAPGGTDGLYTTTDGGAVWTRAYPALPAPA
jgi:photosystem II stability/assembly factor-like uncharacterized protein